MDQFQAADVRQLDVGDDEIGNELPRCVQRLAAVGDGLRFVAVRREQVAEQLDVEAVVLDNQDLRHDTHPRNSKQDLSDAAPLDK